MTFTIKSETTKDNYGRKCKVSISQDKFSNLVNVDAWQLNKYNEGIRKLYGTCYHVDDMKKANATYRRYINKCTRGDF